MQNAEDIAQSLLDAARKAGAEAADAVVARGISLSVGVSNRELEEAERAEGLDLGLRVLIGPRQACVSSSEASAAAIAEMAERAVAMAQAAPEDPYCGLAEPGQLGALPDAKTLEIADPADLPDAAMLERQAEAVEAAALDVPGVTMSEQGSASWTRNHLTMAQSNGVAGAFERTSCWLGVSVIAGTGLGRERDFSGKSRHWWSDLPLPEEIGREAGERAVERLDPKKPPAGRYPVLYDERVSASLIRHLVEAINGRSIARGSSWLRDAMGREILPAGITLVDDPLIRRGQASRPFDAEGIPAAATTLVDQGVLQSWILDLASARQLGLETTGNASRGISSPPSPNTTNLRMTEGARTRADLIRDMGTGLIVTSMIGASINATTGDYSRGASGFWVEGGEIAYPVNEVTVAGSLPEMMRSIVPANDADPMKSVAAPSLLVEGVTIGA